MAIKQLLLKFLDDDRDIVKWLDKQPNTSQSIREAIRLLMDLDSGSTDVLFALFPELQSKLETPSPPVNDDGGFVTQRDFDLLKQLVHSMIQDREAHYQMVEQPLPPVAMKPPKPKPVITADPPADGKSDGSAANNLLASLSTF